ncbi:MAG: adenylate/guanylate cyclase domain-containing protein [bacterium]
MKKKVRSTYKSAKTVYIFGTLFTLFVLFTFLVNEMAPSGIWVSSLENKWHDRLYIAQGAKVKAPDPRILIVAIDEYTVGKLGWPFHRKYYAQLIRKLKKLGAETVVLDVLLLENDPRGKEGDQDLIRATREVGNVSHLALITAKELPDGGVEYSIKPPFKGLAKASQYIAIPNVDAHVDNDGHIRKLTLFDPRFRYMGKKYKLYGGRDCKDCEDVELASPAALAYASYNKRPLKEFFFSSRDWSESLWLNFRSYKTRIAHPGWSSSGDGKESYLTSVYPYISVLDIIEGKLSKEESAMIRGGIIFVGSTAVGAYDHFPSPYFGSWPGVEFHANSLDNLLNDDYLKFVSPWIVALVMVLFIWIPIVLRPLSTPVSSGIAAGIIVLWTIINYQLFAHGIRIYYVLPSFSLACSFVFVTVYKAMTEGREKKWIKNTFGQYLSPKVVEVITKDPSKLSLGGEKRDMTVFFLDIAHFTAISEKMDPEKLTHFLNKYLSALTDVILKHDGVVDKYIGDCIMAFWNAPLDQKEHRLLGSLSAIECISAVEKLNSEFVDKDMPEKPAVRIGLNSGNMVVGNMGSSTRLSYTVIGDEVNLASRLEGANKFFGSSIMVSESTYGGAADKVEARMLGQVRVVGKSIPIKVFELLSRKGNLSPEKAKMLSAYNEGVELFYGKNFSGAEKSFKAALEAVPGDSPSQTYLRITRDYAVIPPPSDWDGVFNLTAK